MNLQADSGKVSACKIKEHQPIPLAPRVGGNAEGGVVDKGRMTLVAEGYLRWQHVPAK